MAIIEKLVLQVNNLPNDLELVYQTAGHKEYIPKSGGIRLKQKGDYVYLLLDSDSAAAVGASVIRLKYDELTAPLTASAEALKLVLLGYIEKGAAGSLDYDTGTYIGKVATHNGDFDVAWGNANSIVFSTLPQCVDAMTADDIEMVRQINAAGEVVAQYDRDDTIMNVAGALLTIDGAVFVNTDTFVVYTNIPRREIREIDPNVYIGKLHGRNGDFDVAYFNATTLRFVTWPNIAEALTADDIELVRQTRHDGRTVGEFDRDNARMTVVGDRLTIQGAEFWNDDSFMVVTNIYKHVIEPDTEFMDSYVGGPEGVVHNFDFTTSYHNYHMINLSGTPDNILHIYPENVVLIKVMDNNNNVYLNITPDEYSIRNTANGLQIDSNDIVDVIFQPTDRFIVYTNIHKKTVGRYTFPLELVANSLIGINDDVWRDQGVEIDCRGANMLSLWVIFQPNDSIGNELKVLSKHTYGGADEYRLDTYAGYIKVLGVNNVKVKYDFILDNTTPYVQVLTRFVGAAGTTSTTSSTTSTTTSTTSTTEGVTRGRIWITYTLGY